MDWKILSDFNLVFFLQGLLKPFFFSLFENSFRKRQHLCDWFSDLLYLYQKELGKTWEDIQNENEEEEEEYKTDSSAGEEWAELPW